VSSILSVVPSRYIETNGYMKNTDRSEIPAEDDIEVIDLNTEDSGNNKNRWGRKWPLSTASLTALFRSRLLIYASLAGFVILLLLAGINVPFLSKQNAPLMTPAAPSSSQTAVASIAGANGIVYIDATDGTLSARRGSDGKLLWQRSFITPAYYLGAASSTALYGITANANGTVVEALRASDGSVLWATSVPPAGPGRIMVNAGIVYYNAQNGTVYALRASDGNELWYLSSATTGPLDTFLFVSDGVACIHSSDGTVFVVRGSDGTELFRYHVSDGINWRPFIENGIIYSNAGYGTIQANQASNGAFLWQTHAPGNRSSLWSEAGGVIYLYNAGTIQALHGTNGSSRWQYKTHSELMIPPFGQQGITYIVTQDDMITALRASDGHLLWQQQLPLPLLYGPAIADGILYLGTDASSVDAWRGSDDLYLWHYTTPSVILWYPLIDNGLIYLQQVNGSLDVVRMSDGVLLWRYQPAT
jgi:outer membrane protein assembly factor BamB